MSCINDYMNNTQFGMSPYNRLMDNSNLISAGKPMPVQFGQNPIQIPVQNGLVQGPHQVLPMPTGFPGGSPTPTLSTPSGFPSTVTTPAQPGIIQVPTTVESTLYTPGFLRTQIGQRVRVEFLIGTTNITDRTGTLRAVGASYILLQPIDSDDIMLCDIYSIKFVTIIH